MLGSVVNGVVFLSYPYTMISSLTVDLVHHYEILETTRFETRDFFRWVNRDNRLLVRSFVYRRIGAVKADLFAWAYRFYHLRWSPGRRFHHLNNSYPTGESLACMYIYRRALLLDTTLNIYLFPLTFFLRNTPEYRMDEQCSFLLCPAYLCWTM